jgi:hypothetical protein
MSRTQVGALVFLGTVALCPTASAAGKDPNLAAALALVRHQCPPQSAEISTDWWMAGWRFNALYGNCLAADGHNQRIWFFVGARFVGTDSPKSSAEIVGLWRDNNTIAFLYVLYRGSDALCCPTGGGKIVRFRWTGDRIVALDPLPPWNPTPSAPVARYP